MAYKTLLFGTDDLFEKLKPFYVKEMERGTLDIIAAAVLENGGIRFVTNEVERVGINSIDIDLAIISSNQNFYERMKQLEAMGIPRDRIIDGRVFYLPDLDFPRLLKEGVAYGSIGNNFSEACIYPRIIKYEDNEFTVKIGRQSFMGTVSVELGLFKDGSLFVGNFSSIAHGVSFELDPNFRHNFRIVSQYDLAKFFTNIPFNICYSRGSQIKIGSDVWIGQRCILKCTNSNKPLIIGDGAVIASDSVVVKSVPPYAIVGGNPAQIIKYRFPPHVIEALLRIKWWDWSLDKIHDNFKYFNDIEKFISLHDKEA